MSLESKNYRGIYDTLLNELSLKVDFESIGTKFSKNTLLKELGFSTAEGDLNKRHLFVISSFMDTKVVNTFIQNEIDKNRVVSTTFVDDKGIQEGNYPIMWINNQNDLDEHLIYNKKSFNSWKTEDNLFIKPKKGLNISVFSRKKSVIKNVNNIDNYQGYKNVGLGGGIRLQLDEMNNNEMVFLSVIMFDNAPPRFANLEGQKANSIPRTENTNTLNFTENTKLQEPIRKALESCDLKIISDFIVNQLFNNDKQALTKLFSSLMKISPRNNNYSVEGVFAILHEDNKYHILGPEIYNFDGLEIEKE